MKYLIRVVQPNISQDEKWNRIFFEDNFERLIDLTVKDNDSEYTENSNMARSSLTLHI